MWLCPKCGARLVTRNLWHSCGRFTLEALLSGSVPGVLAAARKYVALLESLGDVQVLPQKTRLVAVARVRFAGLYPRKDDFMASFALHRWLADPRMSRRSTTALGGARTSSASPRRPMWMTSCAPGCRNRTTSSACRAISRRRAAVVRRVVGHDRGADTSFNRECKP